MKYKLVFIKFILLCLILSSCQTPDHPPLVNADHVFSNTKAIEKIYFSFGKAIIEDSEKIILEKVIQKAQEYPEANITIVGHTDTRGTDEYNLELGRQRANAVKDFILEHDKSLANRITVESKGKSDLAVLVYSNNPEEAEYAHTKNRRVVITLTDNFTDKTKSVK